REPGRVALLLRDHGERVLELHALAHREQPVEAGARERAQPHEAPRRVARAERIVATEGVEQSPRLGAAAGARRRPSGIVHGTSWVFAARPTFAATEESSTSPEGSIERVSVALLRARRPSAPSGDAPREPWIRQAGRPTVRWSSRTIGMS